MNSRVKGDAAGALQHSVSPTSTLQTLNFENCVEQAEICCEQARLAARCRRYRAACGLFDTASGLYERALQVDGIDYPSLKHRLRDIAAEKLTYAELARSLAQPFKK